MPTGIHTNPKCKCFACKAKRGEYAGKNNGMYKKGYLIAGKKNGKHGKKRAKHTPDCTCSFCRAERKEYIGTKNPMFGKKHTQETKNKWSGKNHYQWKGGEYQTTSGRWIIWIDGIKYHRCRYIAMKCLGRELVNGETIHHINEDPSDDRPENLYLFPSQSDHARHHGWKITPTLISNLIN